MNPWIWVIVISVTHVREKKINNSTQWLSIDFSVLYNLKPKCHGALSQEKLFLKIESKKVAYCVNNYKLNHKLLWIMCNSKSTFYS